MKKQRNITDAGDILEMMIEAQSRPDDEEIERESEQPERGTLTPIVSIHGKDVSWHELEFNRRKKKDRAA